MKTNTNSEILLETGTNELSVLEFQIAGQRFGINVSKIIQLIQAIPVQPMPHSHDCVEGIVQPRGQMYTIVNLAKYLCLPTSTAPEKDIYIIANFNEMNIGFHVEGIEVIHRISWEAMEKPDDLIFGGKEGVITSIFKIDGRIISVLDFEKIAFDINPDAGFKMNEVPQGLAAQREGCPILVAEDSPLLRKIISKALQTAGYTNIIMTEHGQSAWEYIQKVKSSGKNIFNEINCVLTDIEMPKMDGHRLTKLIKEDPALYSLPVVIFSSLINENMRKKGLEVGADAQISKPEIGMLVETVDRMIQSSLETRMWQ